MEIILEDIYFRNEEVGVDQFGFEKRITAEWVDVFYSAKVGKEWVKGGLENIPYTYYANLGHEGLIDKIRERLEG